MKTITILDSTSEGISINVHVKTSVEITKIKTSETLICHKHWDILQDLSAISHYKHRILKFTECLIVTNLIGQEDKLCHSRIMVSVLAIKLHTWLAKTKQQIKENILFNYKYYFPKLLQISIIFFGRKPQNQIQKIYFHLILKKNIKLMKITYV
jgi:hypothetical protein